MHCVILWARRLRARGCRHCDGIAVATARVEFTACLRANEDSCQSQVKVTESSQVKSEDVTSRRVVSSGVEWSRIVSSRREQPRHA